MQRRKNQTFIITLIGALLCVTLFAQSPQMYGGFLFSGTINKLTCHFFHDNLFHLMCNALCLWLMRPSPMQIAAAYPIAVFATCCTLTPTIGFSAILYAYLGLNILRWNISLIDWATFIVVNIITIFMPSVAFGVHLASFALGIYVYRRINRGR